MCAVRSLGQQVPRTCAPRESSPLFMAQARKSINRIELKIENLVQTKAIDAIGNTKCNAKTADSFESSHHGVEVWWSVAPGF